MTTRRNVLFAAGVLAGGHALAAGRGVTVTRPGTAFGTTVSIAVTAATSAQANAAIDAGYLEIRAIHKAASLFDPDSETSRLNRTSLLLGPSSHLESLVKLTNDLHALTGGAFDPTVQPLWSAWANSGGMPDQHTQMESLRRVGWHNLHQSPRQLSLRNGAAVTFNGLAQGYAADKVMAAVKTHGAVHAAIDTGEQGRFAADGRMAIRHPRRDEALGWLTVQDGYVAVSGDYASSFTSDYRHHHIFDPELGHSPQELASCIVVASSGALADGLATAFMVMGKEKSLRCLDRLHQTFAMFIGKDGSTELSPGFDKYFQNT